MLRNPALAEENAPSTQAPSRSSVMADVRDDDVVVKDEPMPLLKTTVVTPPRPPLAPTDRGRKRSRSSERGGGGGTSSEYHTPSRPTRESSSVVTATTPLTMTPLPSPPVMGVREPVVYKDTMFSDSEWEREIAEFGRQLDEMLARVTDRQLVAQTAQYMRSYPQHSLRFQIKIKQRALTESPRQAQVKLMLFYLFHEFLKLFEGDELRQIQRDWFLTIDEVLHACMRDMRNNPDMKKRIFKTVARWEELGIYVQKIKQWKALSAGDAKPRRSLIRLPRTEAERLAEAPDQLQQFPPPPMNQPLLQVNRTNYPYVFERTNFRSAYELKQHWRFSSVAFIEVLAQCLGISRDIALTASMYFHRVFDRGIYAKERFKFAAACIFLSAKASSKRMKLIRMVKTMHEILELPLLAGDEEILDIERMQLLYYEIEVLKGVDFDLTTDMPFYYLKETLDQMPEKFRHDVEEGAQSVLEELFWLPLCLSTKPRFLAEAAAYISCRNKDRIFSFSWCREDKDGTVLTEKLAKDILKNYRELTEWKKGQRRHFDALVRTSSSTGGPGPWELQEVFQSQRGGLRIDVTTIQDEAEYTQKGVNESRAILETYVDEEGDDRADRDDRRRRQSSSYSRNRGDEDVRIKTEPRSSLRNDSRGSSRDSYRHESSRSNGNDRGRYRGRGDEQDRDRDRGRGRDQDRGADRDRNRDRDRDRDRDRNRDRDHARDRQRDRDHDTSGGRRKDTPSDEDRIRVKEEPGGSSTRRDRDDKGQKASSDDDQTRVKQEPGVSKTPSDRDEKDRSRDYNNRGRNRSPRRIDDNRSRESDRDPKRTSYRERARDDSKTWDSRERDRESRDRSTRERGRGRDNNYSSRSRRSRSRSPHESSRTSKRNEHSSSRSKSRSREHSSRSTRPEDRNGRDRDRGRDRKRSYSPHRDREVRTRHKDSGDNRCNDRESVKIKEENKS